MKILIRALIAIGLSVLLSVAILTLMNMHYKLKCVSSSSSFLLAKYHHKDPDKDRVNRANLRRVQSCRYYYSFSYKYRHFVLGEEWIK